MNREKDNSSGIKAKVLISFALAIITFISLAVLAYSSYNELLTGVHQLSNPNQKLRTINSIALHLSKAEGDIRAFSVSKDKKYHDRYLEEIKEVKTQINALITSGWNDQIDAAKLDSVSFLLDQKMKNLDDLLYLKRNNGTSYTEKALNQIDENVVDSTELTTISQVKSTTSSTIDTLLIYNPSENTKQIDGFFNKIKRLLSKREPESGNIDTVTRVLQQTRYEYDTNKVVQPDTMILNEVKKILYEVRRQENIQRNREIRNEMELIEANSLIMDQIRGIVKNLEEQEITYYEKQKNNASSLVKNNLTLIFFIVIIALLGCFLGIILIIGDISKSAFYKKRLEKAKIHAEKLARAREQFLANVSHEIRNPLNVVMGYTEQLLKEITEKRHKSYASAIYHSSTHLVSVVNDILDVSKINAGALQLHNTSFNIRELIDETFDTFKGRGEQKGLRMTKKLSGTDEFVIGDPVRLKQILFNLLDNAIKFTDRGSIGIEAHLEHAGGDKIKLDLKVIDTGIGMLPDKKAHIFEDFFQADSSTTKHQQGTGLGLTISKKLVRAMNGTIKVISKPNYGSTFEINMHLPKVKTLHEGDKILDKESPRGIIKAKVLMIEDDHFNRSLLETILGKNIELIHSVSHPYEALKKIAEYRYDLIITDIHMPDMDGVELLRQIRQQGINKSTPVIAVTADSTKDRRSWLEERGFNGILYKPYNEESIFKKVTEVLNQESVVIDPPPTIKISGLDFNSLTVFAGDDHQIITELLEVFHSNALKDVERMNRLFKEANLPDLREHIHKMTSPFSQLGANHIVPIMRSVETRSSSNLADYAEDIEKITRLIFDVLPEVKDKIRDLEIASLLKN